MLKQHALTILAACALILPGCATSQIGEARNFNQTRLAMQASAGSQACPSKWVAAGNNGAKADRYFQNFCP